MSIQKFMASLYEGGPSPATEKATEENRKKRQASKQTLQTTQNMTGGAVALPNPHPQQQVSVTPLARPVTASNGAPVTRSDGMPWGPPLKRTSPPNVDLGIPANNAVNATPPNVMPINSPNSFPNVQTGDKLKLKNTPPVQARNVPLNVPVAVAGTAPSNANDNFQNKAPIGSTIVQGARDGAKAVGGAAVAAKNTVSNAYKNLDPNLKQGAAIAGGAALAGAVGMGIYKYMQGLKSNVNVQQSECMHLANALERRQCIQSLLDDHMGQLQQSKSMCMQSGDPGECEAQVQDEIDKLLKRRQDFLGYKSY